MSGAERSEAPGAFEPRASLEVAGLFRFAGNAFNATWEMSMAKGQMRGNREAKKPKKIKEPAAAPSLVKGTPVSIGSPKKRG